MPGWLSSRAASRITSSPARSQVTAANGPVTSGELYSGWAWSTYSRAPLPSTTFAIVGSSASVNWLGSANSRSIAQPRASCSGASSA